MIWWLAVVVCIVGVVLAYRHEWSDRSQGKRIRRRMAGRNTGTQLWVVGALVVLVVVLVLAVS